MRFFPSDKSSPCLHSAGTVLREYSIIHLYKLNAVNYLTTKGRLTNENAALIWVFFKPGLTPPPRNFGTFGALFRRLFFYQNFWGTFLSYVTKKLGEKCPKTFGFGQSPPLFYPKVQNCWGTKSAPKLLDCLGHPPPPPLWKKSIIMLHFLTDPV